MRRLCTRLSLIGCLAGLLGPVAAPAKTNSLITLGLGAQLGFASPGKAMVREAPQTPYGFIARLKLMQVFGIETVVGFDEDPASQRERQLSPRLQLSAMFNFNVAEPLNIFLLGGLGAHGPSDLVDLGGSTTSFHLASGLEVYIAEHFAVGGDVRLRLPGMGYIDEHAMELREIIPEQGVWELRVWQTNVTISFYL